MFLIGKSGMTKKIFITVLWTLGFAQFWSCGSEVGPDRPVAETILFNGKILTVDSDFSYA